MSQQANLIPRQPRRMLQPRKDLLREALARAADTITGLREEMVRMDTQLQRAREETQRFAAALHDAKRKRAFWRNAK
jgi:hypothetical protein